MVNIEWLISHFTDKVSRHALNMAKNLYPPLVGWMLIINTCPIHAVTLKLVAFHVQCCMLFVMLEYVIPEVQTTDMFRMGRSVGLNCSVCKV